MAHEQEKYKIAKHQRAKHEQARRGECVNRIYREGKARYPILGRLNLIVLQIY